MSINPIKYDGYRFRSVLDARWAVFFKTLGVKYEYEKKNDELNGVWCLPAFWLPELDCWVEIKGQKPTDEEIRKIELLSHNTFQNVHLFYGEIEIPGQGNFYKNILSQIVVLDLPGSPMFPPYLEGDTGWAQCPWCLSVGITYHSSLYGLKCGCYEYVKQFMNQKPLEALFNRCPDLFTGEPLNGRTHHNFYNLAIERWWRDKSNALIYAGDSPRLIAAYTAARQARFERGG